MMCELPSNAILAERFLEYFDGFSIGSNDMTQLTLGVDRDSGGAIAATFDERDDAVKAMLVARDQGLPEGGQVRRHLRAGAVGPSGSRAVAGRAGHREHVAQSRYGGRDVARAGEGTPGNVRDPADVAPRVGRTADSAASRSAVCNARHAHCRLSIHVVARTLAAGRRGHRRRGAGHAGGRALLPLAAVAACAGLRRRARVGVGRVPHAGACAAARDAVVAAAAGAESAGRGDVAATAGSWPATCERRPMSRPRSRRIVWRPDGARWSRAILVLPDMLPRGRLPPAARDAALRAQRRGAGRAGQPGLSVDELRRCRLSSARR